MPSIRELIRQFQGQHESARTANEDRYRELRRILDQSLDNVRGRFQESMDLFGSLGEQELTRAREQTDIASARDEQDLISRGLGSSTLLTGQRRRRDKDYNRYSQNVLNQVSRAKAGQLTDLARLESSIFDRMASAVEGRMDVGPDMGQLSSLIAAASQAGGGGGVTYGQSSGSARERLAGLFGDGGGGGGDGDGGGNRSARSGTAYGRGFGSQAGAGAAAGARYQDPFNGGMAFLGSGGFVGPGGMDQGLFGNMSLMAELARAGGGGGGQGGAPGTQPGDELPDSQHDTLADRLWARMRGD